MNYEERVTQKYRLAHYSTMQNRHKKIKELIARRKSAFNVFEWMFLKEVLNIE